MRASGDVGPNFLLASKASLMALEASGRVVLCRKVNGDRNGATFRVDDAKASIAAGMVKAKQMKLSNFMAVVSMRIRRQARK